MTQWRTVRLQEVCSQDRETIRVGAHPELRYVGLETIEAQTGRFIKGELSKTPKVPQANSFRFSPQHVLYGKLRPYLNKVAVPEFSGKCSTELIPLLPSDQLDRRYLAYFLRSAQVVSQISAKTAGARMPRADMDFVLSLELPLPPLNQQHRIVDILTRAEGIIRLHHEAQKKAAEIIAALFLDMFGDPAANPKSWPIRRVGEFVARFQGGRNLQAGSASDTSLRILKVSAVTSGSYLEAESKPAPKDYQPPSEHFVRVGDMLFSRANTKELVGATALVDSTNGKTLLPDKLWRFVWGEPVEPRYMHALFRSSSVRAMLGKLSTGTSASMRNIAQSKLLQLRLPIAPIEEQKSFAGHAEALEAIQRQRRTATDKAAATFNALLTNAFAKDAAAKAVGLRAEALSAG